MGNKKMIWLTVLCLFFVNPIVVEAETMKTEQVDIVCEEEKMDEVNLIEGFEVPMIHRYSLDSFTGKYGDQLEGLEDTIYQLLDSFKDYKLIKELEVELDDAFSFETTYGELMSGSFKDSDTFNEVRMELRSKVFRASDAFLKDRVDIYWLRSISYQATISYVRTDSMTEETVVTAKINKIKIKPVYYYEEIFDEMDDVEESLNQIMSRLNKLEYADRYELIREIYTCVMEMAEYNHADLVKAQNHTLTGILLDKYGHKGTCEGYAKMIKWLCDAYNIPCVLVIGGDTLDAEDNLIVNHCWNVAMLEDGQWYVLDATWDDTGAGQRYFLAGRTETEYDHKASPFFSYTEYMPFVLPALAESAYQPNVVIEVGTVRDVRAYSVGKNKVKLEWPIIYGMDGYLVYGYKDGGYGYIGMTMNQASFVDYKARDDAYNFYWVFPYKYDKAGKMQAGSCENYVYCKGVCPAVRELKAQSRENGVRLTWLSSRDAEGYLIYGIENDGKYGYIGMTEKTEYVARNASDKVYNFYWVFPYHKNMEGKMIVGETPKYTYGRALAK